METNVWGFNKNGSSDTSDANPSLVKAIELLKVKDSGSICFNFPPEGYCYLLDLSPFTVV